MATMSVSVTEPLTPTSTEAMVSAEIHAVRAQAALVRSLLDELDELAPPSNATRFVGPLAAQAIEELAQLARRMMAAAVSIAPTRVESL